MIWLKRILYFLEIQEIQLKGYRECSRHYQFYLKKYPDTKLYVVGPAIYSPACMKQKVVEGTFNRECREIMDQNSLWAHIEFMNSLDSGQMKERYLRSHAVVSASI